MIVLGTLSILFGCIEYWLTVREMHSVYQEPIRKFPLIMAGVLGSLGVLLTLSIFFMWIICVTKQDEFVSHRYQI